MDTLYSIQFYIAFNLCVMGLCVAITIVAHLL
jgi:hypothetical protein